MARKRTIHAINDAYAEEMERDPRLILFGEDVGTSIFGDTRGLQQRFGRDRVRDTPICETLMAGMAVGVAATGRPVICHLMYGNFVYTAFDAIANQAAKLPLMTNGRMRLPITFVALAGGGGSNAAQHSDYPAAALASLGGLYVLSPSSPAEAKGLLKSAIRSDSPAILLQPTTRGGERGEVPEGEVLTPLGKASVEREGTDVTLIGMGTTMRHARQAADRLEEEGVSVELVDPRTLFPLDRDTILGSVAKTGRLVIADEGRASGAIASRIAALAAEHVFDKLRAPVRTVTTPDLPIAYSPPLEAAMLPDADRIVAAVRGILRTEDA